MEFKCVITMNDSNKLTHFLVMYENKSGIDLFLFSKIPQAFKSFYFQYDRAKKENEQFKMTTFDEVYEKAILRNKFSSTLELQSQMF